MLPYRVYGSVSRVGGTSTGLRFQELESVRLPGIRRHTVETPVAYTIPSFVALQTPVWVKSDRSAVTITAMWEPVTNGTTAGFVDDAG